MRIVDLTHPMNDALPVYPGDPPFRLERAVRVEAAGYNVHRIEMGSHAGTHLDAPLHFVPGGKGIDEFPASSLFFRAALVDLRETPPRSAVRAERLRRAEAELAGAELVLLFFGMDRYWGDPERYFAHPYLAKDAAEYLAQLGIRAVGTDAMSVDETGGSAFPAHEVLMGRGVLIAENLANLGELRQQRPLVILLPLRLAGSDASPVRAVAVEGVDLPG